MHRRVLAAFLTIAIILFTVTTTVTVADVQHYPRTRKLSNVPWLGAPHFQALTKRGRFVFREASNDYLHDSKADDVDDIELHSDKRNWRL